MNRYLRGVALTGVMGLFLVPTGTAAQEVGVVAIWATSPNAELPHPQGLGAFGQWVGAGLTFRLSYLRYSDSTQKQGVVCQVYSPRIGCGTEDVETSARLSGLRASVLRMVGFGDKVQIGVGGGVSFNSVRAESVGDSGRPADLLTPNSGQIGYGVGVAASIAPISGVPLKLLGSYGLHWVGFKGCANPEDRTSGYDPFCGKDRFREIEVGVSYVIPRP